MEIAGWEIQQLGMYILMFSLLMQR
jgi:hypothetical protein